MQEMQEISPGVRKESDAIEHVPLGGRGQIPYGEVSREYKDFGYTYL